MQLLSLSEGFKFVVGGGGREPFDADVCLKKGTIIKETARSRTVVSSVINQSLLNVNAR